jgi:hypothetical protein
MQGTNLIFRRHVNADDRDHDLTPGRLHAVDIEPAGNRADHVLVIDGFPAGRFDQLKKRSQRGNW